MKKGNGLLKRNLLLTVAALFLMAGLLWPPHASALPWLHVNSTESLTIDVTHLDEYIGYTANGTLNHSAGTNTVTYDLSLGYDYGVIGTYNLSGSGAVLANTETIGYEGTGVFNQYGGTTNNVSYDLYLGDYVGSSGTYNLMGGTLYVGGFINRPKGPGTGTSTLNIDGGTLTVGSGVINVDNFNVGESLGTTGTHTLHAGNSLTAGWEIIGHQGIGTFTQTGGTNDAGGFFVGGFSTSSGTYNLRGGDLSVDNDETIGYTGTGVFNQTGGTHTVSNDLYLGRSYYSLVYGNGTYNLSGGDLNITGDIVNGVGTGTLNIDGGTLTLGGGTGGSIDVDYFNVGNSSTNGSFTLNIGQTLSASREIIGNYGNGEFNQTGGTNRISTNLYLGQFGGSFGMYNLTGGVLEITGDIVNGAGLGFLNIDGGTLDMVGGGTIDVDYFNVASTVGSRGRYILGPGESILANGEQIGFNGNGTFTQAGGTSTNTVFSLGLGNNSAGDGTYNLEGGNLSATNETIGYAGTGEFNQTGGTNTITNNLYLASRSGSRGNYNLSGSALNITGDIVFGAGSGYLSLRDGGTLDVTGDIISGAGTSDILVGGGTLTMVGGGAIDVGRFNVSGSHTLNAGDSLTAGDVTIFDSGVFNQTGGTHTVGRLTLGNVAITSNTYNLSGTGVLSSHNEIIGTYNATGEFYQTGGTNTVTGTLRVGWNSGPGGGTYDLSDGMLTVQNTVNPANPAEIINYDTFNYSGGTLNVDTFINNANFNLSGVGTRTVNGDFTNYGTVKATDTTAVFTGTYTEYGTFISDPSDIFFTDLIVESSGYLVGGVGDNFFIEGDFINNSTQTTLWDTTDAYLAFTGAGTHEFYMNDWSLADDFSWETMELLDGGTLSLNLTEDLYVSNFILGDGTNLYLNGFDIYYSGIFTDYGGTFYDGNFVSTNTGQEPVPEPATIALLGIGLAGLAGVEVRRRRKKKAVDKN